MLGLGSGHGVQGTGQRNKAQGQGMGHRTRAQGTGYGTQGIGQHTEPTIVGSVRYFSIYRKFVTLTSSRIRVTCREKLSRRMHSFNLSLKMYSFAGNSFNSLLG